MKRARGRPRKFDEAAAIEAAGSVFWANGFAATSLDDLSEAMGMNRPSIYGAFGDKEALYRLALAQFAGRLQAGLQQTLFAPIDIRLALKRFYRQAVSVYVSGAQPKGCLVMSTAVTTAVSHPQVQADLLDIIQSIDHRMQQRFQQAIESGELPDDFDVAGRALVAQSILHSLSLRARAGDSRANLNRLVRSGVELVLS